MGSILEDCIGFHKDYIGLLEVGFSNRDYEEIDRGLFKDHIGLRASIEIIWSGRLSRICIP